MRPGDAEDFEHVYASEYEAVYRSVLFMVGNRSVAEDATQEAFTRALMRWPRLRGSETLRGWLVQTASNIARRSLRRRLPPFSRAEQQPDLDTPLDIWRAARALPRRQLEAIVLFYVADLPVADVARSMGCSEGAVKAHLARARQKLSTYLTGA